MKKALCALLCAAILLLNGSVLAAAESPCACGHTPLVVVSGMNTYPLFINKGTPEEQQVWAPPMDYLEIFAKTAYGAAASLLNSDWMRLRKVLVPLAREILDPVACNPDGTSKYNLDTVTFPKSVDNYPEFAAIVWGGQALLNTSRERIGGDHTYFFNYDWRLDPVGNARDLHRFIQTVKTETKHAKVDLAVCSMGGAQTLAYFHLFGGGDIENCVFLSSVVGGTLIVGDLLNKRLTVDTDLVVRYADEKLMAGGLVNHLVSMLLHSMNSSGRLDTLIDWINAGILTIGDIAFSEVLADVFCTMPGIWALVTEDSYESAKQTMLDPTKHAALIEKIDYFQYNIHQQRGEILQSVMDEGVMVAFCSHYNRTSLPIFEAADQHSDGVVETPCSSAGAYCAPLDQTLPEDYVQQRFLGEYDYISPDRVIDASTSLFPDRVWFFRDIGHVACPYKSAYNEFVFWLLESEQQPTVHTDEAYPQFFGTNNGGMTLYPLASECSDRAEAGVVPIINAVRTQTRTPSQQLPEETSTESLAQTGAVPPATEIAASTSAVASNACEAMILGTDVPDTGGTRSPALFLLAAAALLFVPLRAVPAGKRHRGSTR